MAKETLEALALANEIFEGLGHASEVAGVIGGLLQVKDTIQYLHVKHQKNKKVKAILKQVAVLSEMMKKGEAIDKINQYKLLLQGAVTALGLPARESEEFTVVLKDMSQIHEKIQTQKKRSYGNELVNVMYSLLSGAQDVAVSDLAKGLQLSEVLRDFSREVVEKKTEPKLDVLIGELRFTVDEYLESSAPMSQKNKAETFTRIEKLQEEIREQIKITNNIKNGLSGLLQDASQEERPAMREALDANRAKMHELEQDQIRAKVANLNLMIESLGQITEKDRLDKRKRVKVKNFCARVLGTLGHQTTTTSTSITIGAIAITAGTGGLAAVPILAAGIGLAATSMIYSAGKDTLSAQTITLLNEKARLLLEQQLLATRERGIPVKLTPLALQELNKLCPPQESEVLQTQEEASVGWKVANYFKECFADQVVKRAGDGLSIASNVLTPNPLALGAACAGCVLGIVSDSVSTGNVEQLKRDLKGMIVELGGNPESSLEEIMKANKQQTIRTRVLEELSQLTLVQATPKKVQEIFLRVNEDVTQEKEVEAFESRGLRDFGRAMNPGMRPPTVKALERLQEVIADVAMTKFFGVADLVHRALTIITAPTPKEAQREEDGYLSDNEKAHQASAQRKSRVWGGDKPPILTRSVSETPGAGKTQTASLEQATMDLLILAYSKPEVPRPKTLTKGAATRDLI
jgi:hypothetical protein